MLFFYLLLLPTSHPLTYPRLYTCVTRTHDLLSTHTRVRAHAYAQIYGKAEFLNPGFSIKDRIARNILEQAEKHGLLKPGMTVVAASSGNTGAATAMMCAMRGYDCVITTSSKCSEEKMNSIKAYGAKLLVTPSGVSIDDPNHYMNVPQTLIKEDPSKYFDVDQYDNLKNPEGHYKTLGPEIWDQTAGTVTHFLAAASTGGTVSGVGKYLKERSPNVEIILPDPVGSIFKEYFDKGTHGPAESFLVEGVGKDTVPGALDISLVDQVIQVTDEEAFRMCHRLAQKEGMLVGGSAGMNVHAAVTLANSLDAPATIVTVLCDTGIKYLTKVRETTRYIYICPRPFFFFFLGFLLGVGLSAFLFVTVTNRFLSCNRPPNLCCLCPLLWLRVALS